MSRLHKILIGMFCAGVFLTGIGIGVMFTEFSNLAYGGKQIIGEVRMQTENIDVEFEPGDEKCYIYGWYQWDQQELLTDERIPENTVRFCVTYNEEQVAPAAYWDPDAREVIFQTGWIGEDDVALTLEAKDQLLKNLKEGKIVSFDTMSIEKITVTVNPASQKDVVLIW